MSEQVTPARWHWKHFWWRGESGRGKNLAHSDSELGFCLAGFCSSAFCSSAPEGVEGSDRGAVIMIWGIGVWAGMVIWRA